MDMSFGGIRFNSQHMVSNRKHQKYGLRLAVTLWRKTTEADGSFPALPSPFQGRPISPLTSSVYDGDAREPIRALAGHSVQSGKIFCWRCISQSLQVHTLLTPPMEAGTHPLGPPSSFCLLP